jgi:tyrosinase
MSFRTAPLELPTFADRAHVSRADLVFYEVDHSGRSYVAHVFLDQPDATLATPRDAEHGYAGLWSVFGHGGCYGEHGHCDTKARTTDAFDRRLRHALTPTVKTLTATDALEPALLDPKRKKVTVTVVIEPEAAAPAAPFELVRLLTYVD